MAGIIRVFMEMGRLIQMEGLTRVIGRHQLAHLDLDSAGEAGMYLRLIVGCLIDRPLGRLIRVVDLIMEVEGLGRRRSIINRHATCVSRLT